MSNNSIMDLQSVNWKGAIPITLSLAPSSLSSPTMPSPVHRMLSRQTFLHIALENEVRRFHGYAPMITNFKSVEQAASDEQGQGTETGTGSGNNINDDDDDGKPLNGTDENDVKKNDMTYPRCWFEETGTPLRWHLFTGILYDLLKLRKMKRSSNKNIPSRTFLPWRIRVHYTSYPETMLPLDEDTSQVIFQHYLNSFKQALYIQHNSNRIGKNMNKQSHLQIWDGIKRSKFEVYHEITSGLNGISSDNITLEHIPVRVLVDGRPSFAIPCKQHDEDDCNRAIWIGDILHECLPEFFPKDASFNEVTTCNWCIQGMKVSLNTPVSDLWKGLCHPDRFLYIIVVTND
jgi:autophagy-related protein 5